MSKSLKRPLSPHLRIYRPQITSVLSIVHRGSGVVLSGLIVWLAIWLILAAWFRPWFITMQSFLVQGLNAGWLWPVVVVGIWSFYYHLANGVRHISWDMGHGFDLKIATISGWCVVLLSLAMTVMTLLIWGGA